MNGPLVLISHSLKEGNLPRLSQVVSKTARTPTTVHPNLSIASQCPPPPPPTYICFLIGDGGPYVSLFIADIKEME